MNAQITIVSGLPRSGTSLMMKMLEQGGIPIVTDHVRKADIDNPEGYYEFEKVKKIKQEVAWVKETRGKVFKMISMLLFDLPPNEVYKIIFMERKMDEVLASQQKMLRRNNRKQDIDDNNIGQLFGDHLQKVHTWLSNQKHIAVLRINYNHLVLSPKPEIQKIISFLGIPLDEHKMAMVVNPDLYRNRLN